MSLLDNLFGSKASEEVIDLHFILSDLKDIPETEQERIETAYYDRYAAAADGDRGQVNSKIPIGKQVR